MQTSLYLLVIVNVAINSQLHVTIGRGLFVQQQIVLNCWTALQAVTVYRHHLVCLHSDWLKTCYFQYGYKRAAIQIANAYSLREQISKQNGIAWLGISVQILRINMIELLKCYFLSPCRTSPTLLLMFRLC